MNIALCDFRLNPFMVVLPAFGIIFLKLYYYMVGYPFYNSAVQNKEIYLSDVAVEYSNYFALGFVLAIVTTPSLAFAEEVYNVSIPAPAPAPTPGGNVPTQARNSIQTVVAIAGCGAAAKQCGDVTSQAIKSASNKLSTVNPPTAVAVGGCLLLLGYCAGKVTTKSLDKMLGFS